jgi:hypothetical protein
MLLRHQNEQDTLAAALTLVSESTEEHEWVPLAWVIRNRAEGPPWYGGQHLAGVVFKPFQFSYWNRHQKLSQAAKIEAALVDYPGKDRERLQRAEDCMNWVLTRPRWQAPFGPRTRHFYSPVSMRGDAVPPWLEVSTDTFVLSGIEGRRFVFARGVSPI